MNVITSLKNIASYFTLPININKSVWTLRNNLDKPSARKAYDLKLTLLGSYIGESAYFANRPIFPHGLANVHISGDAVIGKNAVIFQGVTIGSNMIAESNRQGAPKIGDNCYIGSGAKIIGDIAIGNNCRIGANAVVYKNVPDNSTVVLGGGMRVITHDFPLDNRYFTYNEDHDLVFWQDGKWRKEA